MKKKIPEWIKISDGAITLLKNRIDDAVNKYLRPFINKEKINYLPLPEFLQSILDGRFNNAEKARKYYTTNIYKNCEIKMNNVYIPVAEEVNDVFKEVRKVFIIPTIRVDEEKTDTDTDTDIENIDIGEPLALETEAEAAQRQQGQRIKY